MSETLNDIAKKINLSTATVSRVINNDSSVAPETRERVIEVLRKSGYMPKKRRRSVTVNNTDTVMIIAGQLNNPIILGYIDGIRSQLAISGIRTLISLSDYETETECQLIKYASRNMFTGIILLNVIESPQLIGLLPGIDIPVVLLNRYLRALDTDVVMVDNYRCGYMATQYLLLRGHRHIGHIAGPTGSITCHNRTLGYLDALKAAGLQPGPDQIYYGDRKYTSGTAYAKKLLSLPADQRPTAVFATTALMASGMVDALCEAGLRVPDDISVICNDDYSKDYMPYPMEITCFRQNPQLMGRTAADLLTERAKRPGILPRRIIYPPELSEHNSVININK